MGKDRAQEGNSRENLLRGMLSLQIISIPNLRGFLPRALLSVGCQVHSSVF